MPNVPVIAIVDDDEAVREALTDLLQVTGFESRSWASAEDFLADAAIGEVDCIIADVRMPGMDGLQMQERLRRRGSDTPVIFITSAEDPVTRRRALEGGAHAYLGKPVADALLLEHLRMALGGG